jgi:hypothetical protein
VRTLFSLILIITIGALLALASVGNVAHAESTDSEDETTTESTDGQAKFTMSALDTDRGYVEFDAEPGERLVVNLLIKNTGNAAGIADVYAADAYTLRNGGFGARGIEDELTGVTQWVNYTAEEFDLEPETEHIETITIDVPDDVAPGEHMTSMVIQNQEPTSLTEEGAGIQLDQVSRHAIAIMINIEGEREYGMEIGQAEHRQTGHSSSAYIEVANTGNAMIRPDSGEFRLEDDTGFEMLSTEASMKVIYAGHETHFALNLGERLEPGDYYVWLYLEDEERDVSAGGERLLLHVEEPPEPEVVDEDGGMAGLIQPPRLPGDGGDGSWLTLIAIIAAVSLIAALVGVLLGRRRRTTLAPEIGAAAATIVGPDPAPAEQTRPVAPPAAAPKPRPGPTGSTGQADGKPRLRPLMPNRDAD